MDAVDTGRGSGVGSEIGRMMMGVGSATGGRIGSAMMAAGAGVGADGHVKKGFEGMIDGAGVGRDGHENSGLAAATTTSCTTSAVDRGVRGRVGGGAWEISSALTLLVLLWSGTNCALPFPSMIVGTGKKSLMVVLLMFTLEMGSMTDSMVSVLMLLWLVGACTGGVSGGGSTSGSNSTTGNSATGDAFLLAWIRCHENEMKSSQATKIRT